MNPVQPDESVKPVVIKGYSRTELFEKSGTVVPEDPLKKERGPLETLAGSALQDYNEYDLGCLADYITDTHHRYIKENVEIIIELAKDVVEVHGERYPGLTELVAMLNRFLNSLVSHIQKEEKIIFPVIRQLIKKIDDPGASTEKPLGFVSNAVKNMVTEHEISHEDLKCFRRITNDYSLPPDAGDSYIHLFEKMKEFENDLFQHVQLENKILFPKSSLLDEKLATRL